MLLALSIFTTACTYVLFCSFHHHSKQILHFSIHQLHSLSFLHVHVPVAEVNEQSAISLPHVLGKNHDTGEVVVLRGMFLFGEVAKDVTATTVRLCHHVEEEWLHVKVERLVFKEEFGHETEVLTIHLVLLPVHFKHGQLALPVNLVAGWVSPCANIL